MIKCPWFCICLVFGYFEKYVKNKKTLNRIIEQAFKSNFPATIAVVVGVAAAVVDT